MSFLFALVLTMQEAEEPLVLKGLILRDLAHEPEEGVLHVSGGRLGAEIQGAKELPLPKGAWIVPGFIDLHSHLGSAWEADEPTESLTPHVKAVEGFETRHRDVLAALGSGVTLVVLAPGDGNVVGGRAGLVRLNGARYDRALRLDAAGLKASIGDDALRRDREPTSRTGALRLLRDFLHAHPPQGPVFLHASTEGEIRSAVALAKEAGGKLVLIHAREAGKALDVLRGSGVAVAFGPLTVDDPDEILETPGALAKAGVPLALISDAPRTSEDQLRVAAILALKSGLARAEALKALTETPAALLGVKAGKLATGLDADLVVWSGDPLSPVSVVELVLIQGKVSYRRSAP